MLFLLKMQESLCHSRLSSLTRLPVSYCSSILQAAGVHTSRTFLTSVPCFLLVCLPVMSTPFSLHIHFFVKYPYSLSLEADLRCHLFHEICDSSTCRHCVLHPPLPSFHHPGSDMKNTLDGTKSRLVTTEEKMSGFDD